MPKEAKCAKSPCVTLAANYGTITNSCKDPVSATIRWKDVDGQTDVTYRLGRLQERPIKVLGKEGVIVAERAFSDVITTPANITLEVEQHPETPQCNFLIRNPNDFWVAFFIDITTPNHSGGSRDQGIILPKGYARRGLLDTVEQHYDIKTFRGEREPD